MATNGEIKVEKGVPIISHQARRVRWPFKDMEVGDSFLAPADVNRATLGGAAHMAGKSIGAKFAVRKTTEGVRCWRVA